MIKWSLVKILGKSKIVSLSIFMPFFGYLICFNQFVVGFFNDINTWLLYNKLPIIDNGFIINLFFIYVGFAFIGVASIMYKIFSSSTINNYSDCANYIDCQLKHHTPAQHQSMFNMLNSTNYAKKISKKLKDSAVIETNPCQDDKIDLLVLTWEYYENKLKPIIYIIFIFYSLGFVLLSIPSFRLFFKIIGIIFNI